jgi:hypothetical protein
MGVLIGRFFGGFPLGGNLNNLLTQKIEVTGAFWLLA